MMMTLVLMVALAGAGETRLSPVPVLDADFPDPFIMPWRGGLVAYATNGQHQGRRLNVPMAQSRDGRTWSSPREAMPSPPAWARAGDPDVWAPEVAHIGARYVMYFTARHATRRRPDGLTLCIGVATAVSPQGPFRPRATPLTCGGEAGVIDPSPSRDGGTLRLYMKTDGNCCGRPVRILVEPLSSDGLSLVNHATALGGISNDKAWEGAVIEAPQMVRQPGKLQRYWLFYSGNDYGGEHYAIGAARCDGPAGPCHDNRNNPLLSTASGGMTGPGHQSVFTFRGRDWIAFHAWRTTVSGGHYRALYVAPLTWTKAGPEIGKPPSSALRAAEPRVRAQARRGGPRGQIQQRRLT